jgi:hypothetical protein
MQHVIMRSPLHGIETVTEVTQTRDDVAIGALVRGEYVGQDYSLLLIQPLVHKGGYYPDLGELISEVFCALGTSNEVQEQDMLFGYAP